MAYSKISVKKFNEGTIYRDEIRIENNSNGTSKIRKPLPLLGLEHKVKERLLEAWRELGFPVGSGSWI